MKPRKKFPAVKKANKILDFIGMAFEFIWKTNPHFLQFIGASPPWILCIVFGQNSWKIRQNRDSTMASYYNNSYAEKQILWELSKHS